jgi:glycosyltransferase involved in cell wall biosynthesis
MISIVIPVYNSESSIKLTLDSVIQQTSSEWELIIVNDGSTDCSLKSIEHLVNKYSNKITIETIPNSGQSAARDVGVQKCSGDYILFLDSDDILEPDFVAFMHKRINDFQLAGIIYDLYIFDYVRVVENQVQEISYSSIEHEYNGPDLLKSIVLKEIAMSIWTSNVLYRKRLIDKHNLSFNSFRHESAIKSKENNFGGEEIRFTYLALMHSNQLRYIPFISAKYIHYPLSSSNPINLNRIGAFYNMRDVLHRIKSFDHYNRKTKIIISSTLRNQFHNGLLINLALFIKKSKEFEEYPTIRDLLEKVRMRYPTIYLDYRKSVYRGIFDFSSTKNFLLSKIHLFFSFSIVLSLNILYFFLNKINEYN